MQRFFGVFTPFTEGTPEPTDQDDDEEEAPQPRAPQPSLEAPPGPTVIKMPRRPSSTRSKAVRFASPAAVDVRTVVKPPRTSPEQTSPGSLREKDVELELKTASAAIEQRSRTRQSQSGGSGASSSSSATNAALEERVAAQAVLLADQQALIQLANVRRADAVAEAVAATSDLAAAANTQAERRAAERAAAMVQDGVAQLPRRPSPTPASAAFQPLPPQPPQAERRGRRAAAVVVSSPHSLHSRAVTRSCNWPSPRPPRRWPRRPPAAAAVDRPHLLWTPARCSPLLRLLLLLLRILSRCVA